MIDRLDADTVRDGQQHEFVEALVKELEAKRALALMRLEDAAANGEAIYSIYALGGRAKQLREVILMITKAKGKEGSE